MSRKSVALCAGIALAGLVCAGVARGDDVRYGFKAGDSATYEISVKSELPKGTITEISYLVLHAASVDENGQIKLEYNWSMRDTDVQGNGEGSKHTSGSLAWMFSDTPTPGGKHIEIDPHGAIVDDDAARNDAQLDGWQGPAWRLVLLPPPPAGQNTWTTHRQIQLIENDRNPPHGFGGPFGNPFGNPFGGLLGGNTIGMPANETVTYNADAPQGDQITVHRSDDTTAINKMDPHPDHIHGNGQYVFDTASGRVTSLGWTDVCNTQIEGAATDVRTTVEAHLLSSDELAKLKAASDAEVAQAKEEKEKAIAEAKAKGMLTYDEGIISLRDVPGDMEVTDIAGSKVDGGQFVIASRDHKPVIGFRISSMPWMDRRHLLNVEPLYGRPTADPEKDVVNIVARDGYAVGAITVVVDEYVDGICVTFNKMTQTGLDQNESYTSKWIGERSGAQHKTLSGKGQFVYGIWGRRGLSETTIGLITGSAPGGDGTASGGTADTEAKNIEAQVKGSLPSDELATNDREMPGGMVQTQILGVTRGGGPFIYASRDRKPVIGFRMKFGDWMGRRCFSMLEPLYVRPTAPPEQGVTNVVARDGYAVGSITVNAGEFFNAMSVTFMKLTDSGLDPATSYVSMWYGQRIGTSRIKLAGKGQLVFGICGRKGMNVDAIGLVTDPGPDDSDAGVAAAPGTGDSQASSGSGQVIQTDGSLPSDQLITNVTDLPDGMTATEIMGTTQGGGPFAVASRDRKPVIGFRIKIEKWGDRWCFRILEPLYAKPTIDPESGVTYLLARDGYAVGSITVNAGEFLNAMCVRFMKKTDTGLDANTSYLSPWYGQKVGTSQKKLDGKGKLICGIYGRKGMNVDAIGLIIGAPPAAATDDSDKP